MALCPPDQIARANRSQYGFTELVSATLPQQLYNLHHVLSFLGWLTLSPQHTLSLSGQLTQPSAFLFRAADPIIHRTIPHFVPFRAFGFRYLVLRLPHSGGSRRINLLVLQSNSSKLEGICGKQRGKKSGVTRGVNFLECLLFLRVQEIPLESLLISTPDLFELYLVWRISMTKQHCWLV